MKIKKKEKRDKDLEAQFSKEEQTLLSVFGINATGTKNLLKVIIEIENSWIAQVTAEIAKNKEDLEKETEDDKKEEINKRRDPKELFGKLNAFFYQFVRFKSFFFSYMTIYGTSFGSMTGSPNQATTSALSNQIIEIITLYSDFRSIKNDELEFKCDDEKSNPLEFYLQNSLISLLVGFISKIAGTLIRVKKSEVKTDEENKDKEATPENEEEKTFKTLLESKVLSGGIENRFMRIFSKESRN
jgi:hypothetical protein